MKLFFNFFFLNFIFLLLVYQGGLLNGLFAMEVLFRKTMDDPFVIRT